MGSNRGEAVCWSGYPASSDPKPMLTSRNLNRLPGELTGQFLFVLLPSQEKQPVKVPGHRVRLTSVDCFSDGLVVHWVDLDTSREGPASLRTARPPEIAVVQVDSAVTMELATGRNFSKRSPRLTFGMDFFTLNPPMRSVVLQIGKHRVEAEHVAR